MLKADIVTAIRAKHEMTVKQATELVDDILGEISKSLKRHESVMIRGFGVFEVRYHTGRNVRNVGTGELLDNPAFYRPWFRASKTLKALVNLKDLP